MVTVVTVGIPASLSRRARRLIKSVVRRECPGQSWEIDIAAVPAAQMRRINGIYRRKRYVADVLSFRYEAPARKCPGQGEILVCLAQVKRDARMVRRPWRAHLYAMLVHSCLHVLGFHHDSAAGRAKMEKKEKKYIS